LEIQKRNPLLLTKLLSLDDTPKKCKVSSLDLVNEDDFIVIGSLVFDNKIYLKK